MKILSNPLLWLVAKVRRRPLTVAAVVIILLLLPRLIGFGGALWRAIELSLKPFTWLYNVVSGQASKDAVQKVAQTAAQTLTAVHEVLDKKPVARWGLVALAFWARPGIGWILTAWLVVDSLKKPTTDIQFIQDKK